jgi:hypothetical protein
MKALNLATLVLTIVAGLDAGLVGLVQTDFVAYLFGEGSAVARGVYIIFGPLPDLPAGEGLVGRRNPRRSRAHVRRAPRRRRRTTRSLAPKARLFNRTVDPP